MFSISISSFIFEKIYFTYEWSEINDYKFMLDFFIKGHFVVPFCIFVVVHGITTFIPTVIYTQLTFTSSLKSMKKIIEFEIEKNPIERELGLARIISDKVTPLKLNKEALINLYVEFREHITPEAVNKIEKECDSEKDKLEANFIFACRAFVAIAIYYPTIPYFGWKLFFLVAVSILLYLYLLLLGYKFFDIIPTLIRKFRVEADKYVENHFKQKEEKNND